MDRLLPKTLTGREQSTFSVWSSPSSTRRHYKMAKAGARRIAALEDAWTWIPEGFAFWLAGSLHRRCACGEALALLLLDKTPQILVAYRRLECGVSRYRNRYRYRCPAVSLSHVALKTPAVSTTSPASLVLSLHLLETTSNIS